MQEDTKTHWKLLQNPDYIGAYWLPPGEDVNVTIDYVVREVITGTGGKKEECTVAHLKGVKPFILNSTNSKSIAKLYGPYIEDWAGCQITLYATTTKLAGDTVECLRIRPQVAVRKKQVIAAKRFDAAIESIKTGAYTAQKLEASFELTIEQKHYLDDALEKMAAGTEALADAPV